MERDSSVFVPLALFLRPVVAEPASTPPAQPIRPAVVRPSDEYVEAVRAARRFHAALSDALEAALPELLQGIARDVLARELRLAQPDVAAVVASALDRFAGEKVLFIRAHPGELDALGALELERVADDSLQPGDIRLVLQSGTIDLTLPARLDALLAAWNA